MMHIPAFFSYGHLKTAFLASKAAPYLYASVPHAASSSTMRRLWSLEHRYGLVPTPGPTDRRNLRGEDTGGRPWTSIVDGDPHRFVERCERGLRFAFVRNPYQRLLSVYRAHIATDTVIGRSFRQAAVRPVTEALDFDLFVALLDAMPEHRRSPVFAPQADWLLADSIPFHLVGSLERYRADYATITARISAPDDAGEGAHSSHDAGFSCRPATQSIIARLYERDFRLFGYDADPAAAGAPPLIGAERRADGPLYFTPFWLMVDSRVQLLMGNRSVAIRQIEGVIEQGEAGPAGLLPALRLDLALIHLESGALDQAEALLKHPALPSAEWASLLANIRLHRHDPEGALAMLRRGLSHGASDASFLHELARLSVMLRDMDAALQAGRTIIASAPPGSTRNGLIDALVDGLTRPDSTHLALAVLDDLGGIKDLGYDVDGKLAVLDKPRTQLAVPPSASPGAPPKRVIPNSDLRRLAEETEHQMEALRQNLLRAVLEAYPFLFDADHYSRRSVELHKSGLSPLEHYIRYGSREIGSEANRFFNDSIYVHYMARKPMGHLDPLVHYVVEGAPNGVDPGPHFEGDLYLRNRPDLQGSTANPLNEYLAQDPANRDYYGALPEHVLSEMKALSLYDTSLFPHAWMIGQHGAPAEFTLSTRRQGIAYGRLDRDLPDHFTHLVLIPWVAHQGGAERVSAHVLRLLAEQAGAGKVVAIATDRQSRAAVSMPPGVTLVSLLDYDHALTVAERVEILERLIIERKPAVTFVQNSDAGWTLLAERAPLLHKETALYAFLFGYGFNEDIGACGFHDRLGRCMEYMTGVIADNARFPAVLPKIMPMLSAHAGKVHTIYTPMAQELELHPPQPKSKRRQGLWMSRFSSEKRPDILGRIAAATPDRQYVVYGSQIPFVPPTDAGFLHELPNVTVHGFFRDLNDLPFRECDAFLYTSDFDGLPLALLEAIAMGLPVVAPAVGGIPDIVTAETGWLVSGPDAVDEYVAALREIEANPDLVRRKVAAAQDLLMLRHSWSAFREAYRRVPGMLPDSPAGDEAASSSRITAISLGEDCQSTFQIRRYLKENTLVPQAWIDTTAEHLPQGFVPFPFDWLITPVSALIKAFDTDFKDFVKRENLELVRNEVADYVLDKEYGFVFYHFFERKEDFLGDYEKISLKLQRSLRNWREVVHSGQKIIFVRQTRYPDFSGDEIAAAIRRAFPNLTFVLLVASELLEENRVDGNIVYRSIPLIPGKWTGYDGLWDEALDSCRRLLEGLPAS